MPGRVDGDRGVSASATFSSNRWSARAARHWADAVMSEWLVSDRFSDVELVVGELVANAVVHGCGVVTVCLSLDGVAMRVEVHDEGPGTPVPGDLVEDALGGRGLVMVQSLALDWGIDEHSDGGKTVWAVLG